MKASNILLIIVLAITSPVFSTPVPAPTIAWADSVLNNMTLKEKIGQLLMIAAYSNQNAAYENELENQIRKYHIGGLIFFQGDPVRQANLTNRYQKISKYPLMIGMDAEHGLGWRLQSAMEFPKMLIAGAVRNDSLIYDLGATIARHCNELGVHVNFAPVVDINSNPRNPIIGMRSFGEIPETVVRKASMYVQGSLSHNVLAVIKHFPGHGDTDTDSHLTLPQIRHSRQRLDSIELYPYKEMIKHGIPAVMVSHLNVNALDPSGTPASLSPLIIRDLLKKEMGFNGLCFTDAMNMKGVTQIAEPGEAEVMAILAGNDVLLFPASVEKAIAQINKAVTEGRISEQLITEKCRKILVAKHTYVLPHIHPVSTQELWTRLNDPGDIALKQSLYKEAITLIANNDSILPLKRLDTLRMASLNFGASTPNHFQTMLEQYAAVKHLTARKELSEEDIKKLCTQLAPYNCVIIYNSCATNSSGRNFGYSPSLTALMKQLKGKRIILCHPAIPYGLASYREPIPDAVLVSYENHPYAQQYAAQAIFGGIPVNGQLPVGISSLYPAGTGIRTSKTRLGFITPEMSGLSSQKLSRIDSLCNMAIQTKATPGCQVLVAKNGYILYNKAFGNNTYKKEVVNNTSNIYDLASVTKITATMPAVMKLYDDRRISLSAPLSDYYTALKDTDKKDISLQEILCHNAGLKAIPPLFANAIDKAALPGSLFTTSPTKTNTTKLKDKLYVNLNYSFRDSTISNTPRPGYLHISQGIYIYPAYQDSLTKCILSCPLSPKKEYLYSDLGFILLKYAAEQITGQGFDAYCRDNFYRKLGMNNTDFCPLSRLNKNNIIPSCMDKLYRRTEICGEVHDPTAAMLGGVAGHAGLFSTAGDLAKIMQLFLNQGSYGGEYYFSPSTVTTFTRRNCIFPNNRRALGFDKPEIEPGKPSPAVRQASPASFGHTGFTGTMAWCDPADDLIYIFLSNRTYPDEFNNKLTEENIRTRIQDVIYQAIH